MQMNVEFRTLQPEDASALLNFEQQNRQWFEQFVLPRADAVYSPEGIAEHIRNCLDDYASGTMHPCILLNGDGDIVGRANLKDIDSLEGTTEIGYRIAQAYIGKNVASQAVQHLKAAAYEKWQLKRLLAFVTTENPASARVLEKAGFVKCELIPARSTIGSRQLGCYRYEHLRS